MSLHVALDGSLWCLLLDYLRKRPNGRRVLLSSILLRSLMILLLFSTSFLSSAQIPRRLFQVRLKGIHFDNPQRQD